MTPHILHIVDSGTPADAIEALALLIAAGGAKHQIAVLGHRATLSVLERAGLAATPAVSGRSATSAVASLSALRGSPSTRIHAVPSLGWSDPNGWRGLKRIIRKTEPTHLHAWGTAAAVAAAIAGGERPRIVTLAGWPRSLRPMLARIMDRGLGGKANRDTAWVAMGRWIGRALADVGIPAERIVDLDPAINVRRPFAEEFPDIRRCTRDELALAPQDGPVLLLAGEGGEPRARHDFGLWVGGVLLQIFPRIRVLIREDPRGLRDHGLERLYDDLADGEIPVVVPADYSWERLLAIADVLVVSADGNVSMGAVRHAMAAGVPVAATPIAAVQELVDDGRTGLIARGFNARAISARVEALLSDAALRACLTDTARADAAVRFAPETMVERFMALYERTAAPSTALTV